MQNRAGVDASSYANLENRVIRVFISSTFSDMCAERDVLVKSVFPRLAAVAARRDVSVVPLDLRWGITDEMARSGRVIDTCLNEIVHSRPFFLGLVGNRYGSCLAAEEVGKNRELLERYSWLERDMLDGKSITEIEIQYGVLRNPDKIDAFFYIREGGDASSCDNPEKLSALKRSIRDNGRYPVDSYASADELGAKVEAAFLRLLDSHFPDEPQTELMRERRSQRAFLRSRLSAYIRNDEAHAALDRFMAGDDRNFVLTGPSGMGKSALLANWLEEHRGDSGRKTIYHFVGNGGLEGDYRSIAARLCDEVRDLYNLPPQSESQTPGDKKPDEELSRLYAEISGKEPLLVVLDGINQLHDEDNAKLLLWLAVPGRNVKYIFSTLDDDRTMEVFRSRGYEEYTLQPLSAGQRTKLVTDYLSLYGKRLTDRQVERIISDRQSENTLVLRVLLDELVGFSSHERLDERIDYYLSADSIDEFFQRVLHRIEDDLGETMVRRLLSLITFSQSGLSESELMALSGLDSYRWALFLAHFRGYLTVKGGLLTFSHRYMTRACLTRYAADEHDTRLLIVDRFVGQDTPRAWSELAYQYYMLDGCPHLYRLLLRLDVFDHLYEKDVYQLGKYWQHLLDTDEERFTPREYLNAPGPTDASRATTYNNISSFFSQTVVRLKLSLALAEASLSIRKQIFGEEHEDTATSYNNIGSVYSELSDYDTALEYHNTALMIRQKVLGEEHPDTAQSYNNMGYVYSKLGDYDTALEYFNKALTIWQKVLGDEHPDTAPSYNNIGVVYSELGDYDTALEYHNKALTIRQKGLGEEHPGVAGYYNNIGCVYSKLDDYDTSLEYYNKALSIQQKVLGEEHLATAMSYNNIGYVYSALGDYNTALEYYNKALTILQKVLGDEHPDTATSYNNIGQEYYALGDYDTALEYHNKALTIWQKVLGDEHPETATSYNNIGLVYYALGDYDTTLEYFNKALTIRQKVLGEEHPATARFYNNIGKVYDKLCDYEESFEYYGKALSIYRNVFGDEHPYTISMRDNLNQTLEKINSSRKNGGFFGKIVSLFKRKHKG